MATSKAAVSPILPSETHTVLVHFWPGLWPESKQYIPGKHVILPHVPSQVYREADKRWKHIKQTLEHFSRFSKIDTQYLQKVITSFNPKYENVWNFEALHHVVQMMPADARAHFLHVTLPGMSRLSLELPRLFPRPVPLLTRGRGDQLSLSQRQVACLLAHAFFCTYPRRNRPDSSLPSINFNGLFEQHSGKSSESSYNKLLCLFNYFNRIVEKAPEGVVTFSRLQMSQSPDWRVSNKPLRVTSLHERGTIEDNGHNMLQVSFANKRFGGGVLDRGCVQEEIRCVTCPEMIVARLFTEDLHHNEAFLVQGVERYNKHTGYGSSFKFADNFNDNTPRDKGLRRFCSVVAIDATNLARPIDMSKLPAINDKEHASKLVRKFRKLFSSISKAQEMDNSEAQFTPILINRELNKAFVGFYDNEDKSPVATGNWGCGVFLGNPELKFLLQVMAASQAGRDLNFFTFGDQTLANQLYRLVDILNQGDITVGSLYAAVTSFHSHGGEISDYLRSNLKKGSTSKSVLKKGKM